MSLTLGGSYQSYSFSLRPLRVAQRRLRGIRRLLASDRVTRPSQGPRHPVILSEYAQQLDALRTLPKIAAGSTYREGVPVPRGFLSPAALTFGTGPDTRLVAPTGPVPSNRVRSSDAPTSVSGIRVARALHPSNEEVGG